MSSWQLAYTTQALPAAPGGSTIDGEVWAWAFSLVGGEMGVLRI